MWAACPGPVLQNFDVQTLLTPDLSETDVAGQTQRTLQTAQECGVPVETAYTGQQYTIGTGTLTVLLPGVDADTAGSDDATNDMSLCLRFEAGNFTFLDTGDAERNEEAALAEQYPFRLRSTGVQGRAPWVVHIQHPNTAVAGAAPACGCQLRPEQ